MQNAQPSLFTRPDTILGACEGIGEDFGFNAQILRVALAGMFFWSPIAAVGTYAALALLVLISRHLFPVQVSSPEAQQEAVVQLRQPADEPVAADREAEQPITLAAAA